MIFLAALHAHDGTPFTASELVELSTLDGRLQDELPIDLAGFKPGEADEGDGPLTARVQGGREIGGYRLVNDGGRTRWPSPLVGPASP